MKNKVLDRVNSPSKYESEFILALFFLSLFAFAAMGCTTPRARRTVTRPAWDLKVGDRILVSGPSKETMLTVNGDGTKWEWYAEPEEVIIQLIKYIGQREDTQIKQIASVLQRLHKYEPIHGPTEEAKAKK